VTAIDRGAASFPPVRVLLGSFEYAVGHRTLVIGVVQGGAGDRCRSLDGLRRAADDQLAAGADAIDVAAFRDQRPAGEVARDPQPARRQLDHLADAVVALRAHVGVPLGVTTPSLDALAAVLASGVDVVADPIGRLDRDYLLAVARASASLVVTPPAAVLAAASGPHSVAAIEAALRAGVERAVEAGIRPERIVLDPGAERAATATAARALLGATARFAALGSALLFTAPAAPLAGAPPHPLLGPTTELGPDQGGAGPSMTAAGAIAVAAIGGARLVRAEDVRAARRVGDVVSAIWEARAQP
jgi:dihydropteroate synthase